jgi:hypothetical protein
VTGPNAENYTDQYRLKKIIFADLNKDHYTKESRGCNGYACQLKFTLLDRDLPKNNLSKMLQL